MTQQPGQEPPDTTTTTADTTTTESTTTTSSTTTTTEPSTTTTTAGTTTTSSSTTSTTVAPTTTTTADDGDSLATGASLALAIVLLVALAAIGGTLLWRARQNVLARRELTGRVSAVVARGQEILDWLAVSTEDSQATPPLGVREMTDLDGELGTLLGQIAGARRAAREHDRTAMAVLNDLDRATRALVGNADPTNTAAFRVAVARTRGWLDAG